METRESYFWVIMFVALLYTFLIVSSQSWENDVAYKQLSESQASQFEQVYESMEDMQSILDDMEVQFDDVVSTAPPEEVEPPQKATRKIGDFIVTAYCPCKSCSGGWGTQTALGVPARVNHTIAVDPNIIPLGTTVIIDGKEYRAEDTGSSVKGYKVDMYFDSHEQIAHWPNPVKEVFVYE